MNVFESNAIEKNVIKIKILSRTSVFEINVWTIYEIN